MSLRVLRKLHGDERLKCDIDSNLLKTHSDDENITDEAEKSLDAPQTGNNKKAKKKKQKQAAHIVNPFALLNTVEQSASDKEEDNEDINKEKENLNKLEVTKQIIAVRNESTGAKKKRKKKSKSVKATENFSNKNNPEEDEIDVSLREVNEMLGELPAHENVNHCHNLPIHYSKPLLTVEHRYLNPDNEMKRIFGAKIVQGQGIKNRRHNQNRPQVRATWLVSPKVSWPYLSKTGLSMKLVETKNGIYYFVFQHSQQYQQAQFQFLDAVESLDPNNIMALLYKYPYHIDSLIQLSDVCKMSDDMQMAAELIERALYCFQSCFHPLFTLTQGNCRLDFRYAECRSFYLVLFKRLVIVGQKGCYRTALEFCKLLLSLDPDDDPLCILLMVDFYALRSEQYDLLIRMYQEWESQRNLSQLPNFAFSVALATYHHCLKSDQDLEQANQLLQNALIMFPATLKLLLDKCAIHPDKEVDSHPFFDIQAQLSQTPALNLLIALYVGRTYSEWKESGVFQWLEENTREVMKRADRGDPYIQHCKEKREGRYKGTPRNIYRHILLSEIKDASSALPPELSHLPVMSYDPLPPTDVVVSYTRPPRSRSQDVDKNILTSFFRSLLPNYNLENPQSIRDFNPDLNEEGAVGGRGSTSELRNSVGTLLEAMRDLLSNLQPPAIPRENNDDDHHHQD